MFSIPLPLPDKLYNNAEYIDERHRHRFEVNVEVIKALEAKGVSFVGQDSERVRMEIMEVPGAVMRMRAELGEYENSIVGEIDG